MSLLDGLGGHGPRNVLDLIPSEVVSGAIRGAIANVWTTCYESATVLKCSEP